MICRYSCFFNTILVVFFSFILLSCNFGSEKSDSDFFHNEYYYPKMSSIHSMHTGQEENSYPFKIILEGTYTNCLGKMDGDIWGISSKEDLANTQLRVKKGNSDCRLNLTNIKILNFEQQDSTFLVNQNLEPEKYLLSNIFYSSPIALKMVKETSKDIFLNIRLLNHDFLNNPKFEIIITDKLNLQELKKENVSGRIHLSILPEDRQNEIKMDLGNFGFKKYVFTNDGDFPIIFKGFSSNNTYNSTCVINQILNKGESCSTDLLLLSRYLNEDDFKLSVNFIYNNELSSLKNSKQKISITPLIEDKMENSSSLYGKYIYRLYQFNNTIFVADNSREYKGLFYSKNGLNGDFLQAEGIDNNTEIRGVEAVGETIYAIAYNGDYGENAIGGLFYSKYENGKYNFKRVMELGAKDVQSISSNGNVLYVATKENGLYYFVNGNHKNLKKVHFQNWNYKAKQSFSDVFVFENKVFATIGNLIYYSANAQNGIFNKYELNIGSKDNYITNITMFKDKIYIGSKKGLYVSETGMFEKLHKINELENNEIYDMKSIGSSIYIASPCSSDNENGKETTTNCEKSGIYYANLSISEEFKKISSVKNTIGVFVNGGTIYITTISGVHYLGNHLAKQILMSSERLNQNLIHSHFNENTLYLVKSGIDGGLYYSKNGGKDSFHKKETNLTSGSISSLYSLKDDFYAIVNNSINENGIWYSKGGSDFIKLNDFNGHKLTSVHSTRDRVFVSSENYIYSAPKNNAMNSGTHFEYLSNKYFNGIIKNIFVFDKTIYVIAGDGIYYGSLNEQNVVFKKSLSHFPNDLVINSIYASSQSIYLATSKGFLYSSSGVNGLFQKVNAFGNDNIYSVSIIEGIVYVTKQEGVFSIIISDKIEGFVNKLENKIVQNVFASGSKIYAATNDGISISKNGGRSFENKILGSISNSCNSVSVIQGNIYAATKKGLFVSRNDGISFEEILSPYTMGQSINNLIENDNKIYFSTESGLFHFNLNSLAINPLDYLISNSEKLKKLYSYNHIIYGISETSNLFSSKDGLSFYPVITESLQNKKVLSVFIYSNEIYIGTDKGLVVSKDGGVSFKTITKENENLASNEISGIYKIGSTLYVATSMGVSVSHDGGESFLNKNWNNGLGSNKVHDIFIQLVDIPGFSLGVYASTDNGLAISEM